MLLPQKTTIDAMHDETDEVMNIEGIDIHQSREVTVSTRKNIKPTCNKTEVEIKNHIVGFHKDNNEGTSCSDCTFEAKTPEELNKHLSNSTHKQRTASKKTKIYEKCYTCGSKVYGYVELMDHKKEFHPSNKRCRKFENRMCRFGNKCWYVHEKELTNINGTKEPENVKFEC